MVGFWSDSILRLGEGIILITNICIGMPPCRSLTLVKVIEVVAFDPIPYLFVKGGSSLDLGFTKINDRLMVKLTREGQAQQT